MITSYKGPFAFLFSVLLVGASHAQSVELDFSSLGTSLISFDGSGSSLSFSPDTNTGYDFQIGGSSLTGIVGYKGNIQGNFTIGQITSFGMGMFQGQEAPVTGTGTLSISDGTSSLFTSTVSWGTVATLGTSGSLNTIGVSNLSNFSYSGSNPLLELLAAESVGTATASFQFASTTNLNDLAQGSSQSSTTFSGSLAAIPEPGYAAVVLGCIALMGAAATRRILLPHL
jgi:hypothetical protein